MYTVYLYVILANLPSELQKLIEFVYYIYFCNITRHSINVICRCVEEFCSL